MNEHRDRLIDLLLEEELGGAAPPDLTDRVLAKAYPPRSWRVPLPWLVAAAAALLALLGVAQLWLWPPYPEPRASGSFEIVVGDSVRRGAILRTKDQPATLELGGYASVVMRPGSIVRIEGAERAEAIHVEMGEVVCEVAGGVGTFVVHGPAGSVRVVGTRFLVQVSNEGDNPMMARAMVVRVLVGAVVLVAAGSSTQITAGQEKKAEEKGGTVVGVVVAKGDNFLEVKGEGDVKARRYVPEWVGGAPAQGGGPNKKMVEAIGKIPLNSRVRLEWKFEERPRVIKVEVIKEDKK